MNRRKKYNLCSFGGGEGNPNSNSRIILLLVPTKMSQKSEQAFRSIGTFLQAGCKGKAKKRTCEDPQSAVRISFLKWNGGGILQALLD